MNWNKKTINMCMAFVLGLALTVGVGPVLAVDDYGIFELEGDATDTADPGDDWQTVNAGGGTPYASVFVTDPFNSAADDMYTGGKTKDVRDFDNWQWTNGIPHDKGDIEHAYAAAYAYDPGTPGDPSDDQLVIYAGLDRFARDGSGNVGFWFLQQDVHPQDGGTFGPGVHMVGDIFVVIEFTQGGAIGNADVYRWIGGKKPLESLVTIEGANCNDTTAKTACAYSNTESIPLYWSFTPKAPDSDPPAGCQSPPTTYCAPQGSFVEVGINISEILPGDTIPCFTSFIAETRASHEENSILKDFVYGEFNICELDITKTCTSGEVNANQTGFVWGYEGTVTNKGFGTVYKVRVIDAGSNQVIDTPLYGTAAGDDYIINVGTLDRLEDHDFSDSFETIGETPNPAINVARVEAALTPTGDWEISDLSPETTCPSVSKSPDLFVEKECEVGLEELEGKVVVKIDISGKVCNEGDVQLENVTVVDDRGTPDTGDDVSLPLSTTTLDPPGTPGGTLCATFSDSYYPTSINAGSAPGDPCGSSFQDTVRANGDAILGLGAAAEETKTATCPMCPPQCEPCP